MSDDVLIRCENVGKKFCRDLKQSLWYGVKDATRDLLGGRSAADHGELRPGEFWANEDISFELKRGECLGLLGKNGAGKTTLLKVLNGLIKPDVGRVEMRGRVGTMIALGAGFNPILTGRENIYVNGSVLGLSRQAIRAQFDKIIDFSGLEEFIDTPLRNYSSGMQVRLGFACAVCLISPDILILDEVLAVGDAGFRAKCYGEIAKLVSTAAVILVSHNMEAISRICDRGIFLERGRVSLDADAVTATQYYLNAFSSGEQDISAEPGFSASDFSCTPESIQIGEDVEVRFTINSPEAVNDPLLKVNVCTVAGVLVGEFNSHNEGIAIHLVPGTNKLCFSLKNLRLLPQDYTFSVTIISDRSRHLIWWRNAHRFRVSGKEQGHQNYLMAGTLISGGGL